MWAQYAVSIRSQYVFITKVRLYSDQQHASKYLGVPEVVLIGSRVRDVSNVDYNGGQVLRP